jgi:hypothetical protein
MLMSFDLSTSILNTFQADTKFAIVLITGLHCVKWCQNISKLLQRLWTERLRIEAGSSCQYANQLSGSANSKKFLITWGTNGFSRMTLFHKKCSKFQATLIEYHSYLPTYNTACDSHPCRESHIGWYGYRVRSVSGTHWGRRNNCTSSIRHNAVEPDGSAQIHEITARLGIGMKKRPRKRPCNSIRKLWRPVTGFVHE